jgi:hypothetical protein
LTMEASSQLHPLLSNFESLLIQKGILSNLSLIIGPILNPLSKKSEFQERIIKSLRDWLEEGF